MNTLVTIPLIISKERQKRESAKRKEERKGRKESQ